MRDTERDNFMNAQQAAEYGLIDSVLYERDSVRTTDGHVGK
ncbi:protease, subunit of ATP-dependent Clp protease [Legionella oakridgensis ATCC 33761 = DSM 21215]|uniref:Protease, subunit of ATP-dependent Clp protease n=2 Tax=Legionella oakridgensis TaxID=29423 RepID=W0BDF8_9GAMM|nr:protease, subunit of ATP-dependent Clp protease [Legionella oakridgensis ATCC 33761 = DSM 21215]